MRSTAFQRAIFLPALVSTAFLAAALPAAAQQAPQADRCEGTLCDLYYHNAAPPQAEPQAAGTSRPLMVPSTGGILSYFTGGARQAAPTAGQQPSQQVVAEPGSGGLVAMMKGTTSDRCTGTLCDLYYGGPPPEHPVAPAPTTVAAQPGVDAEPSTSTVEYVPVPEEPKHCVSPANDPWRCYRR